MPLIVSDTSPLNYLVLIEAVEILSSLFASITIPAAVKEELSHPNAPSAVKSWIASPPSWLRIISLKLPVIPSLAYLGPGEAEVISVALEQHVNLLLMDDHEGTREARQRGLYVVGTLAVLDRAAARSLLELPEVFRRLQTTT